MKPRYVVGIDPDIDKSGFAVVDTQERMLINVRTYPIADAVKYLDYLGALANLEHNEDVLVVIEDSDSNTNWHLHNLLSSGKPLLSKLRIASAIGRSAGLCHAVCRVLREYAESVGLKVRMQKPLRKCWRGKDGKITQIEAAQFMTGLPKRCNQECRDSALIAWCVAELPIRIPPRPAKSIKNL